MNDTAIDKAALRLVQTHVAQMNLPMTAAEIEATAAKPYWRAMAAVALEQTPAPRTERQEEHLRQAQALGDP